MEFQNSSKSKDVLETRGIFSPELYKDLRHHMRTIINLKLVQLLKQDFELKTPSTEVNKHENSESIAEKTKEIDVEQSEALKIDSFDCGICFEEFKSINAISFGCEHQFCGECIADFLSTQISEGIIENFNCPYPKCEAIASETIIEQFVPPPIYERYLKLQIQKGVSAMDDVFYCPNTECHAIVECEVDVGIGSCNECEFIFCTSCLQEYHGTSDCYLNEHEKKEMLLRYQIQKVKDEEIARQLKIAEEKRKAMEEEKRMRADQDKASESFIKVSYKKCPGCQSDVEKNGGCNRMSCTTCGNNFCWLCLAILPKANPYSHFGPICQTHT